MSAESNTRDHLANERTFLAWTRTALGLIGLGFVLARMGLFLRQLAVTTNFSRERATEVARGFPAGHEFLVSGVGFLVAGMFLAAWAAVLHDRNRRAIATGGYEPATKTVFTVAAVVVFASLVLIGLVVRRVLIEG